MKPNLPVVFPASPWPWPSAPGWAGADGKPDLEALARSFPQGTAAPVVAAVRPRCTMSLQARTGAHENHLSCVILFLHIEARSLVAARSVRA